MSCSWSCLTALVLQVCLRLAAAAPAGGDPVVDVGYASYTGNQTNDKTVAYLGVPYAEPPVGDLRFRATVPLNTTRVQESSGGQPFDAKSYPDFCVQGTTGGGEAGGAGSEDCLKLNIYAPAGAKKGDLLPVLVYIHGGGYIYGNPRNWPFDDWIPRSPNVVIASVYYRLDSFGFLASPAFNDSAIGDFNAGFLDQQQALKWVKQYIDAFGGDPRQVTINGQSAGGSSVELHLVSPTSQGLYSGAIAQSVYRAPVPDPDQQQPLFEYYAQQAGCASGDVAEQMGCLRNASVSALARAQDAGRYNFTGDYNLFHPVLDGQTIPGHPTALIQSGQSARVPLMVGATSNETLSGGTNITAALKDYFPALTDEDLAQFEAEYPAEDFSSAQEQFRVATGEPDVRCGREIIGGAYANDTTVWAYRYNQANPTSSSAPIVEHAAENWMMFDGTNTGFNGSTTFTPQTPTEIAFTDELIAYWLSFVRAKDPNTFKLDRSPTWTQYTVDNKVRIVLQEPSDNSTTTSGSFVEPEPEKETARCAFSASKVDHEQD